MGSLESIPHNASPYAGQPRNISALGGARHRFSLGGIALEILPEPGFAWTLPPETEQHTAAHASRELETLATLTCSLRVDKGLLEAGEPQQAAVSTMRAACVTWEKTLDGVCVRTGQSANTSVVLDIAELGPRRYVASARIASPALLTLLLNTLVTSVAELAGGLCLHATAVALVSKRGALLLLGPSGAGKTTAAQLLGADVTCLSNDRVTLVADPVLAGKYWVWSLPIGMAPELERCSEVCLPLLALLRVQQAKSESQVVALREVEALLQIRQAVEVSAGSEFFEPQRLAAVGALASAARSGVAHVALSAPWRPHLEAFLAQTVLAAATHGSQPAQPQKSVASVDGAGP